MTDKATRADTTEKSCLGDTTSDEERESSLRTALEKSHIQPPITSDGLFVKRGLFGGAITCYIPTKWRDVSDVRQVPDHQEVYQDCEPFDTTSKSNANAQEIAEEEGKEVSNSHHHQTHYEGTGGVVIIEILERHDTVSDDDAARFFFDDLAKANGCPDDKQTVHGTQVVTVGLPIGHISKKEDLIPNLGKTTVACTCTGTQLVAMEREKNVGEHKRLQEFRWVRIELCAVRLKVFKTELLVTLTVPLTKEELDADGGRDTSKNDKTSVPHHSELFREIISSLTVKDWNLFA